MSMSVEIKPLEWGIQASEAPGGTLAALAISYFEINEMAEARNARRHQSRPWIAISRASHATQPKASAFSYHRPLKAAGLREALAYLSLMLY